MEKENIEQLDGYETVKENTDHSDGYKTTKVEFKKEKSRLKIEISPFNHQTILSIDDEPLGCVQEFHMSSKADVLLNDIHFVLLNSTELHASSIKKDIERTEQLVRSLGYARISFRKEEDLLIISSPKEEVSKMKWSNTEDVMAPVSKESVLEEISSTETKIDPFDFPKGEK